MRVIDDPAQDEDIECPRGEGGLRALSQMCPRSSAVCAWLAILIEHFALVSPGKPGQSRETTGGKIVRR